MSARSIHTRWYVTAGTFTLAAGGLIYAIRLGEADFQAFLLYNLPDGLWAFGFASLLLALPALLRPIIWVGVLGVIGIAGEMLQLYHVIAGTFDPVDIVCYLGGIALALLCNQLFHFKNLQS